MVALNRQVDDAIVLCILIEVLASASMTQTLKHFVKTAIQYTFRTFTI